ncbi:hypothetical protein CBR_g57866 [Chara braunii]|uniref:Uncharacterized protein n=1 Tax=Chara braunii TaxID=69332 RepID=A0A388K893_CHABU|nr:hypothetical protein CBR_g57866 [Chara braunii]|eukprot:GBG66268.1 hypothetical protein CBR_g57866 [Chara braunii]
MHPFVVYRLPIDQTTVSAVLDSGAVVLAISLRVVRRAGRWKDVTPLAEGDHFVSVDEDWSGPETASTPPMNEDVELVIIQAWRTGVEGDLLGFVFGSVEAGHRQPIVGELLILLTQILDDLPIDVISHCDESPAPHILPCSLTPYLQWSTCLEADWDNRSYPSHGNYLNPAEIIDFLFLDRGEPTSEEEEKDEEEGDKSEDTSEEDEYYSEHSEHESGVISKKEEEEEEASEEEEAEQAGTQGEDPTEAERRSAEIAEGK